VELPQKPADDAPFARIKTPSSSLQVLFYMSDTIYSKTLIHCLNDFNAHFMQVTERALFLREIEKARWQYIFIGRSEFTKVNEALSYAFMSERSTYRPYFTVFVESGSDVAPETTFPIRIVSLPVWGNRIAAILDNRTEVKVNEHQYTGAFFTAPNARVLVVDDIATNGRVVEGLMAPCKMRVDRCLSGPDAIRQVQEKDYDLVFMDHMMPGMDGIEATRAIRALPDAKYKNIPIIALTANAMVGMRQIFLENGFNDYLSKPIEMPKLNEILWKWIPEAKRQDAEPQPTA
jgi:CheY-like chemotaxis protein